MDFKNIKNKLITAWNSAKNKFLESKEKAVKFSAKKLSESWITIRTKESLEDFIKNSKNTTFLDKETWKNKTYKRKVIIIFANEKSDFFKNALFQYPILITKAFSQDINLKLALSKIEGVDYSSFNIKNMPSLVVFENQKPIKTIEWKENIEKLVKSLK